MKYSACGDTNACEDLVCPLSSRLFTSDVFSAPSFRVRLWPLLLASVSYNHKTWNTLPDVFTQTQNQTKSYWSFTYCSQLYRRLNLWGIKSVHFWIFYIVTLQIKCQNMCCIFIVIKSYLNLLSEQNVLCDVMYWCVVNFALFNTPLYFIHTLSINSVHDIHI